MKHVLLFFLVLGTFFRQITVAGELVVDNSSYEDFIHVERGRGLMSLLGVPSATALGGYSSWSFPSSIVVDEEPYCVKQTSSAGSFKIFSPTNSSVIVARGGICRTSSAEIARVCGFGEIALNSLPLRDLAGQISVQPLDSATNVLYLANTQTAGDRLEVMVAKNYFIYLRSSTNNLAFALSVLNAGLPVSERITRPLSSSCP